jgi:hypothetical protein
MRSSTTGWQEIRKFTKLTQESREEEEVALPLDYSSMTTTTMVVVSANCYGAL